MIAFRRRCGYGTQQTISRNGSGLSALAQDEIQITQVDEYAKGLTENEDGILAEERVGQQQHATADGEPPERQRNDAASGSFGSNPLDKKAHREQTLRDEPQDHPPIQTVDKNVAQIAADCVRQINEQGSPPERPQHASCAGSATILRQDPGCRS